MTSNKRYVEDVLKNIQAVSIKRRSAFPMSTVIWGTDGTTPRDLTRLGVTKWPIRIEMLERDTFVFFQTLDGQEYKARLASMEFVDTALSNDDFSGKSDV